MSAVAATNNFETSFATIDRHAEALLGDSARVNPFCTAAFAAAMAANGGEPWLLGPRPGVPRRYACAGFITATRLHRLLDIPSLPALDATDPFWRGLPEFCSRRRITIAELNTYAATVAPIPTLPRERRRQQRVEFALDLARPDWESRIARVHWQSIHRARAAGLSLRRGRTEAACNDHVRLLAETRARWRRRGIAIPCDVAQLRRWTIRLSEQGAGEIFQACAGGESLASVMVLRAPLGAYGESAGSVAAARALGAAHFLIHAIAASLQAESVPIFHLGGAEGNAGLRLFKSHFGAREVRLDAVTLDFTGHLRRGFSAVAARLRV